MLFTGIQGKQGALLAAQDKLSSHAVAHLSGRKSWGMKRKEGGGPLRHAELVCMCVCVCEGGAGGGASELRGKRNQSKPPSLDRI